MDEKIKKLETWQNNQIQKCAMHETRAQLLEQNMCQITKDIKEIKDNQKDYMADMNRFRDELFERLDDKYVSKIEFEPIKDLVYKVLYFVILAVVAAVIGFVIKN